MEDHTDQQDTGRRERIGTRPWVRSAALVGSGLVAGGILAGTLTATAATDDETGSSTPSTSREDDGYGRSGPRGNGDPSQPQRDDEELLTGDTAQQVTDAVLAEYPDATIQRVETDSDGVYEAHIVTADGEQITVELGKDFAITGTEEHAR